MEGSQVLGVTPWSYAVALGDVDPYALVDDAFLPMHVAIGQGRGNWSDVGDLLRVDGAEVSSVRRVGTALEVRVFNPTPQRGAGRPRASHAVGSSICADVRSARRGCVRSRPVEDRDAQVELTGEQRLTSGAWLLHAGVERRHTERHRVPSRISSHSSAGRVPCHRTANETSPQRVGMSCAARFAPCHSGGRSRAASRSFAALIDRVASI